MLNNKKFNIILSIIIAVVIWAYVIGETNPTDTKTYRDIPISYINESVLEEEGLAVLSTSAKTLSVTLSGTRSDIAKISESDILAIVDLSEASEGSNELKITLRTPESVEIEDRSLRKVSVEVEELKSKEVDIEVDYQGTFENEEEPITVDMSRHKVTVSGAASLVDQVVSVRASVEEGSVTDTLKTIRSNLVPVDQNGLEIENLSLSAETVEIAAELAMVKTVTLSVPITDHNDDIVKSTAAPKTITIKGMASELAEISSVTTEEVDISDITEDTTIALTPILPDNVQISEKSGNLTLTVTVETISMVTRNFTFDNEEINLTGLDEDLTATVRTSEITINISGSADVVNALSKEDFVLRADLSDLEAGSHQVDLQVSCNETEIDFTFSPQTIRVVIE